MAKDTHNHHDDHTEIHVENHSEQVVETDDILEQADELEATEKPIKPHVEELDRDVSDLATKVSELTDDLMRVQADFNNFRRRSESERAELLNYAKAQVVRELLTVRDNLDRAMAHKPAELSDNAWAQSFDAIVADFDAVLARLGVKKFASAGEEFDPHRHEAVATEGDGSHVIEELQPGYLHADTVLRHAVVKVGDKPGK